MLGENPDDLETRRAGNNKTVADAVTALLDEIYPLPPNARPDMPGTPQQSSQSSPSPATPPPRDFNKMSDAVSNGQYRELRVDVENLKTNFSDLRHDIDARFKEQSDESRERHREMLERIDKQNDQQNSSKLTLEKAASVVGVVATIILSLVWGYSQMQQGSINDKIVFTNEKIARDAVTTREDVERVEKSVMVLTDALSKRADKVDERFAHYQADTVPRREADNRFERDEQSISHKLDKDVFSKTTEYRDDQVASLRADVSALLRDTQKRADLDARFGDFTKRLDLISNRVEQLQSTSAGTAILQEQLREAQSQIKELRDHWLSLSK